MSFESLVEQVTRGGTVTDADVNEWIVAPWYVRLRDWLLAVVTYD